MMTYLLIIGKISLALMLFYIFYLYVLAKDKLFKRNRFYLLGATILSFVLPWIKIPIIEIASKRTLTFSYIEEGNTAASQLGKAEYLSYSWIQILLVLYIIGIIFFVLKTLLAYFQVFRIIKNALHIPLGKQKLVATPHHISPFSFFHWIVVPETIRQHPSFDKMVQHEMIHCRQYHSVDLFIGEVLIFLQWFNPFAWLLRKAISENLEYLVDEEMLAVGTDARDYQYSLLSFSMVGLKPAVANYFNTNLLKKRIAMMNTRKFSSNYRLHNFLIPVCLVIALVVTASFKKEAKESILTKKVDSQNLENSDFVIVNPKQVLADAKDSSKKESVDNRKVISISEVNVEELLLGYLMKNVNYPVEAVNINLEGNIDVSVTFNADGAEMSKQTTTGERLKQVVVVAYGNDETSKHAPTDPNSESINLLQNEVFRVVKSFTNVPEEMIGKTYIVSVKFLLEKNRNMNENTNIPDDGKLHFRQTDNSNFSEAVVILNDEKIISKEEMQQLDIESIQSIQVNKNQKYEHKKLGTFNNGVIIITMKNNNETIGKK